MKLQPENINGKIRLVDEHGTVVQNVTSVTIQDDLKHPMVFHASFIVTPDKIN